MKQCNATKALEEFHGHVATSSVKAVVGCGCSAATEEVAKISYLWNITVVSNCLNMHGLQPRMLVMYTCHYIDYVTLKSYHTKLVYKLIGF